MQHQPPHMYMHQQPPMHQPPYMQQPPPMPQPPPMYQPPPESPWSTGFCDCLSDFSNCCITCWCPCITFGQIAEIVDRGSSSCGTSGALYALFGALTGCACIYSCFYRTKMRRQYNLEGNDCTDCLSHICCELCALTQEYRELQNRGYDMSLGWHGNMEGQQNPSAPMAMGYGAPEIEFGMKR